MRSKLGHVEQADPVNAVVATGHNGWRRLVPRHSTVAAYLALFIAMGGTAAAATGGTFLLGKANSAGKTTSLKNTGAGPALSLSTSSNRYPPLSVNNSHLVSNLNASYLDGLPASSLGAVQSAGIKFAAQSCSAVCGTIRAYGAVSGLSTAIFAQSSVDTLTPDVALVARDFTVQLTAAPGTMTVVVGISLNDDNATLALSCHMNDAATTCTDPGAATIPAGSRISISVAEVEEESTRTPGEDVLVGFQLAAK